jgi:hypothetical protein
MTSSRAFISVSGIMTATRLLATAMLITTFGAAPAFAASAINLDAEPRTIAVTEGGLETEIVIPAGGTAEFCPLGCFVRMPDGRIEVLTGFETIEISGGEAKIR